MMAELSRQDVCDLLHRKEELHKDLVPYVSTHPGYGQVLHHPFIIDLFFDPTRCGMANAQYKAKTLRAAECLENKELDSYITLHERPYRYKAFTYLYGQGHLHGVKYWKLLSSVWIDSENIFENLKGWKTLWRKKEPYWESCMTDREYDTWCYLPDLVTCYRGVKYKSGIRSISWTTDCAKAEWFANRLLRKGEKPMVAQMTIEKSRIRAYLNRRDEHELIIPIIPKEARIKILD
jgi:hypothetical protein